MDEFKKVAFKEIGPGGMKCICCGPGKGKGKKVHRRRARRRLRQADTLDLKETGEDTLKGHT